MLTIPLQFFLHLFIADQMTRLTQQHFSSFFKVSRTNNRIIKLFNVKHIMKIKKYLSNKKYLEYDI